MAHSTLAAVQCLDDGRVRAFHRTGTADWLTAPLAAACWSANPRIAGYALNQNVAVSETVRTRLIASRKQRRTVLECAHQISNWSPKTIEHLLGFSPSSYHHIAGITGFPLSAITSDVVRKLAATCTRRSCVPNMWLAQCHRLVERGDLKTVHRDVLVEAVPEIVSNPAISAATALKYFERQGKEHRRGLAEAVAANPNISCEEAVDVLQKADPADGDYLTIGGMRRLVQERGEEGAVVDAVVILMCRSAKQSWPRVEGALRELVEADGFREEHYEYIRSHLRGCSLPLGVLCAWQGIPEKHLFETMAIDRGAGVFAFQNDALSERTQFQVAHSVIGSVDTCGDWFCDRVHRLRALAAEFIANRAVLTSNSVAAGALIRVPRIPAGVFAKLVRNNLALLQRTDGHSPSALTWALAENEIAPEVRDALLAASDELSPDERTAAVANFDCPDDLSERLLAISDHRGPAFALAVHPRHDSVIREACIAALAKTEVAPEIIDLLSEHNRQLSESKSGQGDVHARSPCQALSR